MRLDVYQRRALFDLICWVLVLAVFICVLGSFIGCTTGTSAPDVTQKQAVQAQPAAMRVAHTEPVIIRVGEHRCRVIAPDAVSYELGGVHRQIGAAFTCPTTGVAQARWGSGTRYYIVNYSDGQRVSVAEWWPEVVR